MGYSSRVHDAPPHDARWPDELRRLQAALLAAPGGPARQALRGSLWRLLFEALSLKLHFQSRSWSGVDRAVLEDIAAEKALELLERAERGAWDLSGRSASEISGYLGNVARNGWADHEKRRRRERASPDPHATRQAVRGDALEGVEANDAPLAEALLVDFVACVEALPPRGRLAWFLRAHHGLSGREIAAHPALRLNVGHVDVLVQRTRTALKECLRGKGHTVERLPAGAFVALWELFEALALREAERAEKEGSHDER